MENQNVLLTVWKPIIMQSGWINSLAGQRIDLCLCEYFTASGSPMDYNATTLALSAAHFIATYVVIPQLSRLLALKGRRDVRMCASSIEARLASALQVGYTSMKRFQDKRYCSVLLSMLAMSVLW